MGDNSDKETGVYIVQIVNGGAADKAGLKEGDRIESVDGKEVSSLLKSRRPSASISDW